MTTSLLAALVFTVAAWSPVATVPDCPCPAVAAASLAWRPPDDPAAPAPCSVRSRTGQWMDARQHPACQAEALRRCLR